MNLILFTGPNCSLCDLAIDIVAKFNACSVALETQPSNTLLPATNTHIELEKVNIRESTDLYHLYGARIPVLKNTKNESELAWPFTLDDLIEFLK